MIRCITWDEVEEKYPDENDRRSMIMGYGNPETKILYIDYGDYKTKEKHKQINNLVTVLFNEIASAHNYYWNTGKIIPIDIPNEYSDKVKEAVNYKREAEYFKSLKIYKEIFNECGVSEALINGLYKTMVAAGHLAPAAELINIGIISAAQNNNQWCFQNDKAHLNDLLMSSNNEKELFDYMKSVSGNPNYISEFPYEYLKQQVIDYVIKYQNKR